jgi:hypothetical protein
LELAPSVPYVAANMRLQHRLPPLPWSHSVDEVDKVRHLLSQEKTPFVNQLTEAHLFHMHMLVNGTSFKYIIP